MIKMHRHWMFNCRAVSERFSKSLDTPLPLLERLALRFHFMMCRYCDRYRRQLLFLRKLMRLRGDRAPEDEALPTLPPEARARIKEAMAGQAKE